MNPFQTPPNRVSKPIKPLNSAGLKLLASMIERPCDTTMNPNITQESSRGCPTPSSKCQSMGQPQAASPCQSMGSPPPTSPCRSMGSPPPASPCKSMGSPPPPTPCPQSGSPCPPKTPKITFNLREDTKTIINVGGKTVYSSPGRERAPESMGTTGGSCRPIPTPPVHSTGIHASGIKMGNACPSMGDVGRMGGSCPQERTMEPSCPAIRPQMNTPKPEGGGRCGW